MQNNIKRIDTKSAFSAEEEDEVEIVETKQNQPQTLFAKIRRILKNVYVCTLEKHQKTRFGWFAEMLPSFRTSEPNVKSQLQPRIWRLNRPSGQFQYSDHIE